VDGRGFAHAHRRGKFVPPALSPSRPTLIHYQGLFTRLNIGRTFGSSLLVAYRDHARSLLFNSMAGYAFAKLRFPGRDRLFGALLAAMVIPGPDRDAAALPDSSGSLGLVNSYAGRGSPRGSTILGVFLIRQFARGIPDDLLDAARLDGAGELKLYGRIVLPLLRPVLYTLAIVTFLATWNDFIWPLIVLTDERRYTLPVALASLVGEHVQDTELMMAGSVLTVLPVLILFLLLQKQYIEGITLGGCEGVRRAAAAAATFAAVAFLLAAALPKLPAAAGASTIFRTRPGGRRPLPTASDSSFRGTPARAAAGRRFAWTSTSADGRAGPRCGERSPSGCPRTG
jgi:multiple sugar transport system permease protein